MSLAVIAASMVSLAIATGFERSYGVIKRLGGSPAGTSALVASKTAAVIVVEAVQMVLLVAIALGLGWSAGPTASLPLAVAGLVLGTVAFAGFGLLMAGTLRAEATLALANLLFLVSLVLGGIVLPLDRLPATVAAASGLLPPAALTKVLTIGLGGATGDATESVVVLAVLGGAARRPRRPQVPLGLTVNHPSAPFGRRSAPRRQRARLPVQRSAAASAANRGEQRPAKEVFRAL